MKRSLPWGAAIAALFGLVPVTSVLAQPILQQRWPAANAVAAPTTGSVWVQFEPAPSLVVRAAPLWVHSAQRGGRRTGHSGQVRASSKSLTFEPGYPFQPGEVVYATTWAAGAANQLGQPQQWQFTTAVGGTGEGLFLPGSELPTPALAPGLALGDVDNDGDLDLLTASAATSQVLVRLNGGDASSNGAGQYAAGTLVEVGHPAYSLALGDVDNDGDLDLLTGSDSYGTVSVRLNGGDASGSGTGRFSRGQEVRVSRYATALCLALGDVDGDGDLDLLAAGTNGVGTVSVRLNGGDDSGSGTGVFSGGELVRVGSNPFGLALGDVDNDGDLDLLTANWAGTVSVRLNTGQAGGPSTGRFGLGPEVAVAPGAVGLALGDVDNDGDLDLLTTSFTTGSVSVRLNGGGALGAAPGHFGGGAEVPVGSQPQRLALADVDHDGDLDLLAACTGAGSVSVRLNGGNAAGTATGRFGGGSDPDVGPAPVGLALADIDADGDLDLLTTSLRASQVSVRLNQPWPRPVVAAPADAAAPLAPSLLVQAYPNPSVQAPALTICTNQAGPATLLLADALGRLVSQRQLALSPGTTTLPLAEVNDLAAGLYLLHVQQGSQRRTIRLVRQ